MSTCLTSFYPSIQCLHYVLIKVATLIILKHCTQCGLLFLNQVHPSHRPHVPGFLNCFCVDVCMCACLCFVFVCMCPPPRLLITSGVMWTPFNWLNKFYSCYLATVVIIVNGHSLGIGICHRH